MATARLIATYSNGTGAFSVNLGEATYKENMTLEDWTQIASDCRAIATTIDNGSFIDATYVIYHSVYEEIDQLGGNSNG